MYLNLSKVIQLTHRPLLAYNRFTFPGGEEHLKITDRPDVTSVKIISDMRTSGDVLATFLATDAVRHMYGSRLQVDLIAPYIPYARQDRRMVPGEPLSIKVIARLINCQGYRKVMAFDPHSDVTSATIDNLKITTNHRFVAQCIGHIMDRNKIPQQIWNGPSTGVRVQSEEDVWANPWAGVSLKYDLESGGRVRNFDDRMCLISPDAGAQKKIFEVATYLNLRDGDVETATKRRNVATGKIVGTAFEGNVRDKICIIVDDIIDGGRSFTGLGSILKQKGAQKVYLIASHGIFSAGIECLQQDLDGIYITDSINTLNTDFVTTIPLERVMEM